MNKITIEKIKCGKCGYKWFPRYDRKPIECPMCKNRKWDIESVPVKIQNMDNSPSQRLKNILRRIDQLPINKSEKLVTRRELEKAVR